MRADSRPDDLAPPDRAPLFLLDKEKSLVNDLKPQLAPGWSAVNIVLLVGLFLLAMPLGLLMLAYILFGARLGLDLGRPETFGAAWQRLVGAFKAGSSHWGAGAGTAGGTPSPTLAKTRELEEQARALAVEREALDRERAAFEQDRKNDARDG